ncbi:MAG: hypothetical protein IJ749_01470 [Eubacterium sp.]|nr:hypothetical protein [Eubacterium sp.]
MGDESFVLSVRYSTDVWYRYTTRFALPVYGENGEIDRYNVFRTEILIRQEASEKMYLYDLVNIKKETSTPLES